jgi:hypothetical protein
MVYAIDPAELVNVDVDHLARTPALVKYESLSNSTRVSARSLSSCLHCHRYRPPVGAVGGWYGGEGLTSAIQ